MPEDGGSVFIEEWCLCVGSGEGEGKKTGRTFGGLGVRLGYRRATEG